MAVEYSVRIEPGTATLGEGVAAVLHCRANENATNVVTFDHKSLVLELNAETLAEPLLAFPNRFAVEDGGKLIRMSTPGGIEDLGKGEERARTFDLVELFPAAVLNVGKILFTFRLEEANPPVHPAPVTAESQSGPEAVPLLIELIRSQSSAVRFRADELLQCMTGKHFANSAEWLEWWTSEGVRLPWNYAADGASFNALSTSSSGSALRTAHLGGVQYAGQPNNANE